MCCDSDAPDTSGVNRAAEANVALSKEQLDWVKQTYADGADDRKAASDRAREVSDANLASLKQNTAISSDYNDYQKNTFRPLEQGIVSDAAAYDTTARRDAKAGEAVAGVTQQFAASQDQNNRAMQRMGINPSSGRSLAMSNQLGIAQATASAGAAQAARNNVETQGYARKMDAANLGRNLASNQATSATVALNAGNSSVINAQVPLTVAANATNAVTNGMTTAGNLNTSAGNLYGTVAQIQQKASAQGSADMAAIGNIAGAFVASDIHMKTDIGGIDRNKALQAVRRTPVSNWRYKSGSRADDGGKLHTGPMAQDVQATMGNKAAPNGTAIDLVTMNGISMAAIQALSDKVDRLAGARGLRRSA